MILISLYFFIKAVFELGQTMNELYFLERINRA